MDDGDLLTGSSVTSNKIKTSFSDDLSPGQKEAVLSYELGLRSRGLLPIVSIDHFALICGVDLDYLFGASNRAHHYYRTFFIEKKNGRRRRIDEPMPLLKHVQRLMLDCIASRLPISEYCKSYRFGYSPRDAAKFHIGKKVLVREDIKEFFNSISQSSVYKLYYNAGYTRQVSAMLAGLSSLNGSLPQGAPTSGALSNAYLYEFDSIIGASARKMGFAYTRYADDMFFSSNFADNIDELRSLVSMNLNSFGLKLNKRKSKKIFKHQSQRLLGFVLNKNLNVSRKYKSRVRQEMYYIRRYGPYGHARHIGEDDPLSMLDRIIGQLAHIKNVERKNEEAAELHSEALELRAGLLEYENDK